MVVKSDSAKEENYHFIGEDMQATKLRNIMPSR
jgi:hypothetical protein